MIETRYHDIFTLPVETLVNPVNCKGAMGKGLALQFKHRFLGMNQAYQNACRNQSLRPGQCLLYETGQEKPKSIVLFPTKDHWQHPSKLDYIDQGMQGLVTLIHSHDIRSIAIPPLGCGLGGLDYKMEVGPLLLHHLQAIDHTSRLLILITPYPRQGGVKLLR